MYISLSGKLLESLSKALEGSAGCHLENFTCRCYWVQLLGDDDLLHVLLVQGLVQRTSAITPPERSTNLEKDFIKGLVSVL